MSRDQYQDQVTIDTQLGSRDQVLWPSHYNFQESLRLSIMAKVQNKDLKLENFFQIVRKVVVVKAKANL